MEEEILNELREIKTLIHFSNKNTFNVKELCIYAGMSKQWIYQLLTQKQIPHYKRGTRVYFDRAEIDNWLKGHKVETIEDAEATAEVHDYMNK